MAEHGGMKKEADPEEILQRKFHMKCLFRAFGRMVMANAYWLIEASEQYEGVDDVKRRVEQAVRSKAKKKQLLNINVLRYYYSLIGYYICIKDKTLLNKPAEDRTEQEKKYLYRIIGGLKCFKRYPNNVKRKLAAVTYFKYYGPGRTIVRQHHEAHALYFIVTGDVVVSQMIFDELLQQYISVDVGDMHPGDMFGEVSLLHNIPRTATVTTIGHCELLALMKDDFKSVLQATIQKQWDEVRRAMSAFTYFDALDEVAQREGCIVAKMKSYEPNDTLLGDGVGVPNFVYFVLSGRCQMIESMQVIVTKHLDRHYYTLFDPHQSKEEPDEDLDTKYLNVLRSEGKTSRTLDTATSSKATTGRSTGQLSGDRRTDSRRTAVSKEDRGPSSLKDDEPKDVTEADTYKSDNDSESQISENLKSKDMLRPVDTDKFRDSLRLSVPNILPEGRLGNLHTYFMQVCQFNPGSSFGFGENMRDRRIVALTPVSCLLLPLVWLLQRNSANIWTRIKYFLDKRIITKKQLFEVFVAARHWSEYRDQLVTDAVARSKTVNSTSIHDVPYSIRTEELLD